MHVNNNSYNASSPSVYVTNDTNGNHHPPSHTPPAPALPPPVMLSNHSIHRSDNPSNFPDKKFRLQRLENHLYNFRCIDSSLHNSVGPVVVVGEASNTGPADVSELNHLVLRSGSFTFNQSIRESATSVKTPPVLACNTKASVLSPPPRRLKLASISVRVSETQTYQPPPPDVVPPGGGGGQQAAALSPPHLCPKSEPTSRRKSPLSTSPMGNVMETMEGGGASHHHIGHEEEGWIKPISDIYQLSIRPRDLAKQFVYLEVGKMLFNTNPRVGIAYWQKKGFLKSDLVGKALQQGIGEFLFQYRFEGLSQKKISAYLGDKANEFVAIVFLMQISLQGLNPTDAFWKASQYLCISGEADGILQLLDILALVYVWQNANEAILSVCYPSRASDIQRIHQWVQSAGGTHQLPTVAAQDLPFQLSILFYSILVYHKDIFLLHQQQGHSSSGKSHHHSHSQQQNHHHRQQGLPPLTAERYCDYVKQCDPHLNVMICQTTYSMLESQPLLPLADHTNEVMHLLAQFQGLAAVNAASATAGSMIPQGSGGVSVGNGLPSPYHKPVNVLAASVWAEKWGLTWPLVNDWRRVIGRHAVVELKPGQKLASNKKHHRQIILLSDYILVAKPLPVKKKSKKDRLLLLGGGAPTASDPLSELSAVPLELKQAFPLRTVKLEILQSPPYPFQSFYLSHASNGDRLFMMSRVPRMHQVMLQYAGHSLQHFMDSIRDAKTILQLYDEELLLQ